MGLKSRIKEKLISKAKETIVSTVKTKTENTFNALHLIMEQFKFYVKVIKYIFIAFSLALSLFNIFTGTGNKIVNFILIGLLAIYLILDTIFGVISLKSPKKILKIAYTWLKILINGFALGSTIYSLYLATSLEKINPISIVLTTLSIIMFIIKVILEIICEVVMSKWNLLKAGLIMDGFIQDDPEKSKIKDSHRRILDEHKAKRLEKKLELENVKENEAEVIEQTSDSNK